MAQSIKNLIVPGDFYLAGSTIWLRCMKNFVVRLGYAHRISSGLKKIYHVEFSLSPRGEFSYYGRTDPDLFLGNVSKDWPTRVEPQYEISVRGLLGMDVFLDSDKRLAVYMGYIPQQTREEFSVEKEYDHAIVYLKTMQLYTVGSAFPVKLVGKMGLFEEKSFANVS